MGFGVDVNEEAVVVLEARELLDVHCHLIGCKGKGVSGFRIGVYSRVFGVKGEN